MTFILYLHSFSVAQNSRVKSLNDSEKLFTISRGSRKLYRRPRNRALILWMFRTQSHQALCIDIIHINIYDGIAPDLTHTARFHSQGYVLPLSQVFHLISVGTVDKHDCFTLSIMHLLLHTLRYDCMHAGPTLPLMLSSEDSTWTIPDLGKLYFTGAIYWR